MAAETKTMYRVIALHGNGRWFQSESIRKILVKKGRKYYSEVSENGYDRKYNINSNIDQNGNRFYQEESDYSPDFILYETESEAKDYVDRLAISRELRSIENVIYALPLNRLRKILNIIKEENHELE